MLRVLDLRRGDPLPEPTRLALDVQVVEGTRAILARVRAEGDAALVDLTATYDGADVDGRLRVPGGEIEEAEAALEPGLRAALADMAARLRDLHGRQVPDEWDAEEAGVRFGEVVRPVSAAGCYVPGGRASYPSSVLMTVIPAKIAGVPRVALCTPPAADGTVTPPVLYAAALAGADEVYRVGGAQAIGALAYGTETIAPVDVIAGPGNAWVTAAKREVSGEVGIDGLAGPTELAIVAAEADPAVLAIDLVAQAEHDPLARTWLVCLGEALPARVSEALAAEVAASPRREIVEQALERAVAIVVDDEHRAVEVVDRLAPEHLQILTEDPRGFLGRVRNFGAAFLGPHTPVPFGDYGAWSNHVLPTMGNARFSSGLRTTHFLRTSGVVESSPEGAAALGPGIERIAAAEGLPAHGRASEVRR